jgi:ParB family chromosome partitioning protein
VENSRLIREDEDFAPLMRDIKFRGLLQPIGLLLDKNGRYIIRFGNRRLEACKKLGWKKIPAFVVKGKLISEKFMSDNIAENDEDYRKKVSIVELARVIKRMMDDGKTKSEVASILNKHVSDVDRVLRIISLAPEGYLNRIKTMSHKDARDKKGDIPLGTANLILNARMNKIETEKLFKYVQRSELSQEQLAIVMRMMEDMSIEEAIAKSKDFGATTLTIVYNKSKMKELFNKEKGLITVAKIIRGMLKGKVKTNPSIFE